ncbi:MAG: hypothetical protein OEW19_01915 [Acidobacteriota bacterium]|nr:hypothetical protein [Acidobacteriota bacterium]
MSGALIMLLPFFEWCEASALGEFIRTSLWLFPAIECVHLLGLVLLGGAVLVVDLRLLGLGLSDHSAQAVGAAAHRLMLMGVGVMLFTGLPLFLSEAVKCYYSDAFWVKITTLVPAILFALTVRRWVWRAEDGRVGRMAQACTALTSLALWFTVAAGGRWIGFS